MPNQRLLVVDDDVGMRQALCDTLSAEGFETLVADDGATALAVLDAQPVDLVLTDIQMPNVDGMHLMRAVRERSPEQPIIMMTVSGADRNMPAMPQRAPQTAREIRTTKAERLRLSPIMRGWTKFPIENCQKLTTPKTMTA